LKAPQNSQNNSFVYFNLYFFLNSGRKDENQEKANRRIRRCMKLKRKCHLVLTALSTEFPHRHLHSKQCLQLRLPAESPLAGETVASPPAYAYSAARHHCAYEYISTGNLKTWPMVISCHTDRTGTRRLRDVMNTRLKPLIFILAY
jgi:hypothetical protein